MKKVGFIRIKNQYTVVKTVNVCFLKSGRWFQQEKFRKSSTRFPYFKKEKESQMPLYVQQKQSMLQYLMPYDASFL